MLKIRKKSWEPSLSCLLSTSAYPAQFRRKWAGLAVLFSRQLPNGSHNCFYIFSIFVRTNNPQEKIDLTFLTLIISGIGGVNGFYMLGKRQIHTTQQCLQLFQFEFRVSHACRPRRTTTHSSTQEKNRYRTLFLIGSIQCLKYQF